MDKSAAHLDQETLRLVVQLQLDDLKRLSKVTGKQVEGKQDDFAYALSCLGNDLGFMSDHDMAASMAEAVQADAAAIRVIVAEEKQVADDRRMALEVGGGATTARAQLTAQGPPQDSEVDDEMLDKLCALYMAGSEQADEDHDSSPCAESSSWAASRRSAGNSAAKKSNMRKCCSCQDQFAFYDVARAPCSHEYCRRCIKDLFNLSLTDETLYPPRCCQQPIPAEDNRLFLGSSLVGQFLARKVEMETPDRTYCHIPDCGKFIPAEFIERSLGYCVTCDARTCTMCKEAAHLEDCPQDPDIQSLNQMAKENGWQQCCACKRLVDLSEGCHHISKFEPVAFIAY